MKLFLLVAFGIADLICLVCFICLWKSSRYSGAEIGNMDWGLAKLFGLAALMLSALLVLLFLYKK